MDMTKIKEQRIKSGLSQSQLCDISGVNIRTLQMYEQGTRNINGCNLKSLIKLCKSLNCKLYEILDDEELVELIKEVDFK